MGYNTRQGPSGGYNTRQGPSGAGNVGNKNGNNNANVGNANKKYEPIKNENVGDNVFGKWSWVSNIGNCRSVCRIMVGWDSNVIGANLISYFDEAMHFEINFVHDHRKQFVTFVYAKNFGSERKALWENLVEHSKVVRG